MKNLDLLYKKIELLLSSNQELILAIDGNAGSGKTRLAGHLSEKYKACVFHMDDFFLPPSMKTPQRLAVPGENIHWERFLLEVLQPLKDGREIHYKKYDCRTDSYSSTITLKPERLVIIEGVYSLHPKLSPYYDLKIFMGIDWETQKERLAKREEVNMLKRFLTQWLPMEEAYFQAFNIPSLCDFVLRGEDFIESD